MVKLSRTKVDRDALPDSLLDTAKTHMRVEFTRDDEYIKLCIRRAIDFFERTTGLTVNPTEFDWAPGGGYHVNGQWTYDLPFQPEPSFTVADADGTDISDQFAIIGQGWPDEYGPRLFTVLDGAPFDTALTVKVTAGYADQDTLPPGILNFILQAASWFYEYREAGPMPGADGVPYLNQLLTSYWVPRA